MNGRSLAALLLPLCGALGCNQLFGIEERDVAGFDAGGDDAAIDTSTDGSSPDANDANDAADAGDTPDATGEAGKSCASAADCPTDVPYACVDKACLDLSRPYWKVSAPPSWKNNGDLTITDQRSGLTFMRRAGTSYELWDDARLACAGETTAGGGFRLASRAELTMVLQPEKAQGYDTSIWDAFQDLSWSGSAVGKTNDRYYVGVLGGVAIVNSEVLTKGAGHAWCVRGPAFARRGALVAGTASGTLYDEVTTLTWRIERETKAGGTVDAYSWAQAKAACVAPYRLPTLHELMSLVDERTAPAKAIVGALEPTTPIGPFWSIDPAPGGARHYMVDYTEGALASDADTAGNYVRCVRD